MALITILVVYFEFFVVFIDSIIRQMWVIITKIIPIRSLKL